jgi:hypothetical protein
LPIIEAVTFSLEVIELADQDLLDVARSRAAEQEVLDRLDEAPAR